MLITSLSVPGKHLDCAPRPYGDIYNKLYNAYVIWTGAGMTLQVSASCLITKTVSIAFIVIIFVVLWKLPFMILKSLLSKIWRLSSNSLQFVFYSINVIW